MVEQQGLDTGLEEVDEEIVAPDVRQFVRQKPFKLLRRKAGEGAGREENERRDALRAA
jgi:hypothetical protein